MGLCYKKDTLIFEKKNIFWDAQAIFLKKYNTSLYEMRQKADTEKHR